MAKKETLNLSGVGSAARKIKASGASGAKKSGSPAPPEKKRKREEEQPTRKSNKLDVMSEEEEDEDDEELFEDLEEGGSGRGKMMFYVAGALVVVVIIIGFLLFFGGKRGQDSPPPDDVTTPPAASGTQDPSGGQSQTPANPGTPDGLGVQDFTQDTNNNAGNVLTDPDNYVQDIYGLTTRVDYTVQRITSVADFVSYEKHRGTWGGGLELYWLDATYKNNHYVIQVPFQYYKELDDVGIVPVKMEVLTITGTTEGETLSVISYMCLDEKTLSDIIKNQNKSR